MLYDDDDDDDDDDDELKPLSLSLPQNLWRPGIQYTNC